MRILKFIVVVIALVVGYALGNFFPFGGSGGEQKGGIMGSAKLEVMILDENNKPVTGLEVDVADKPGPPKKGGAVATDTAGVAAFNIQPGNYVIYFNSGNFPQNLREPELQQIQVSEGSVTKKTIILRSK